MNEALLAQAEQLLQLCRDQSLMITTAESCTGGLIAAYLTAIPGSSDVVERCFVTYSNEAKNELLGVPVSTIARYGAVSEPVARLMAEGALLRARAGIAIAVTGIAGPGGGSKDKPVGLVHVAVARTGMPTVHQEHRYGAQSRAAIRQATVESGLKLLIQACAP